MIALNIVLMAAVVIGIVSLLAWAVASDRKSSALPAVSFRPPWRRSPATWRCRASFARTTLRTRAPRARAGRRSPERRS